MKCQSCNTEWKSPGMTPNIICPFCHSFLIDIPETFQGLDDLFMFLVSGYGSEILKNKQNVLQIIDERLFNGKQDHNLVNMVYSAGLMDTILRTQHAPEAIQKSTISIAKSQLCEKYGIVIDWADYVIDSICRSLGMCDSHEMPFIQIKKKAEEGDAAAQYELAECFREGKKTARNIEKYLLWLKKSANNGNIAAMYNLGKELWTGIICPKNASEAVSYLTNAVQKQSFDAICFVAADQQLLNATGLCLSSRIQEMIDIKEKLSVSQLLDLGQYFSHCGNNKTAIQLVELAYIRDKKSSWENYVALLQLDDTPTSHITVTRILREVAIQGNVNATMKLAGLFERNAQTSKDYSIVVYWYRMAAEQGSLEAQLHLAEMYESGSLIEKNIDQAAFWYRTAASNGAQQVKSKVDLRNPDCIIKTLTFENEDGLEAIFEIVKVVVYNAEDYLILSDLKTKEFMVAKYIDNGSEQSVEQAEESIEQYILKHHKGTRW